MSRYKLMLSLASAFCLIVIVAHPVDVSLDPVQDFGRLVIGNFLHNHQVTYLWDGLWMKNTLCPYLVSTLQCFFVSCFGLCINLWQQIEGKKFKLALATIVDVKIQAYVVVGKCLLSESYFLVYLFSLSMIYVNIPSMRLMASSFFLSTILA